MESFGHAMLELDNIITAEGDEESVDVFIGENSKRHDELLSILWVQQSNGRAVWWYSKST